MKQYSFLLFITLIISLLSSCGKAKGRTQIEGQVLEKGSNRPVANANVIFSQCVAGDGTFSPKICLDIETVKTDAEGRFTFTKDDDDADEYRIRAEKENYGKTVEVFQTAPAEEKTKNIKLTLPAFAWIKFHIKNVNPFDDSDLIIGPGSSGTGSYYFYGKKVDTIYSIRYIGNSDNNINWYITKNGINTSHSQSIYTKGLDTSFYEIKY